MGSKGCFNKGELKARGWSDAMIEKYLGKPDSVRHLYFGGVEFQYAPLRVHAKESLPEFQQEKEEFQSRRQRGKDAAKKRADNLCEKANAIQVKVVCLDDMTVMQKAIEHYNRRNTGRSFYSDYDDDYYWQPASMNSSYDFLQRITVNYIRHNLTSYDRLIKWPNGKTGKQEAIKILQTRVFDEIAKTYPHFAEECERQKRKKGLTNVNSSTCESTELECDNSVRGLERQPNIERAEHTPNDETVLQPSRGQIESNCEQGEFQLSLGFA